MCRLQRRFYSLRRRDKGGFNLEFSSEVSGLGFRIGIWAITLEKKEAILSRFTFQ